MANVLFISEARLKSLTAIHDNVEPNDLMPFVLQAQDIYVQDVLGTKFYNSLKTAVSGGTLTTEETTLINDYISPELANYSLYLAIPTLNYKFKNKSIKVKKIGKNDKNDITINDKPLLRVRPQVEGFKEFIMKYLEQAPNTADAMKRHKAGKAGFTDKAHLKAKGLIPRSDGEKRKSDKYK